MFLSGAAIPKVTLQTGVGADRRFQLDVCKVTAEVNQQKLRYPPLVSTLPRARGGEQIPSCGMLRPAPMGFGPELIVSFSVAQSPGVARHRPRLSTSMRCSWSYDGAVCTCLPLSPAEYEDDEHPWDDSAGTHDPPPTDTERNR